MRSSICRFVLFTIVSLSVLTARGEVMLQWFETEWDEMYRRMPEVSQIGYDHIWTPPPTKAPTGLGTKWGNVGYSLYDRFDLGDVPQRGSYATRYGTRGSLRHMVDAAHQLDVKIIPDIVMNHNGNGPDFRCYPGMVPEDFHVQWEQGHCNTLNYKRGPRMGHWYHDEGYGGTMWQDLCSLIDIRTEPDDRFTGGSNTPGWNFVAGANFLRHPGQYDRYPYFPNGYTNETASQMLYRWITWLGNAMDYDGLRIDAAKHTPWEFFGTYDDQRFLHEAQWNHGQRRGYSVSGRPTDLFDNYLRRRSCLIFAEILSPWGEIEYWFRQGNGNPMRFLDYQIKKTADSALEGSIGNFNGWGTDFGPNNGIMYVWGHDEGPKSKVNLGYAYILTHVGLPMVYFTGNNLVWADKGTRTWMIPGYDSQALADQHGDIANLVWIHQQFARGSEQNLWADNDYLAYERYDAGATSDQGLLVVALNDSGWDQTRTLNNLHFSDGTVLHDYTGHNLNPVTVNGGSASITVPGNYGQGWVCYAPRISEGAGEAVRVKCDGNDAPTMTWIVPGGIHAASKTQQITRITSTNISIDVFFDPVGGPVDAVMLRWAQGKTRFTATNYFDTGDGIVSSGYEKCFQRNSTNWYFEVQTNHSQLVEGLNVIKARVFNERPAGRPALFNTFTKVVYVDTKGPQLNISWPQENETIQGSGVMIITNTDFLAYGMTVKLNDGAEETAHQIMKGLWKYNLDGLDAGTYTAVVTTTEADWGDPRQIINTSVHTRVFHVAANTQGIGLNHAEGSTIELPFFNTVVTAPGSPSAVRLYWNGYEIPVDNGLTNVFDGRVIFRDFLGNVVTDRLWGAFVNGQNFFEAERVDAGVTSRVSRRVVFNLYGINAIDSDGDGLPDNLEMPFIDSDGAPGADAAWPGDSNHDFVPNYGENWTRLNPYNHSTFYSTQWDGDNDFDGDGFSNLEELLAGYHEGDIYKYSIYDANNKPSGAPPTTGSSAWWAPSFAVRDQNLDITYSPGDGPLKSVSPVVLHIGHSKKSEGEWQEVTSVVMTAASTNWTATYPVPTNATSVDFCFRNEAADVWDNNNGRDWQAPIQGDTNSSFNIDGARDSDNYLVWGNNMYIWAAVRGTKLYVSTWGDDNGNDHFIFVTDEFCEGKDAPWGKAGRYVHCDTDVKPYLGREGDNGWAGWFNVTGTAVNDGGNNVLEGEFDLVEAFGCVPESVYVAAAAYGTAPEGEILSQSPWELQGVLWVNNQRIPALIEANEFLRLPIDSIRDENADGVFDKGSPSMVTVVNGNTNDANYGLRRFFINELAGESHEITVILTPNCGTNQVADVELFSNLNRRDFAVLEEDPASVTTDSRDTYFRAYPMTDIGGGRYSITLKVNKCGAYRINARYKVAGGDYVYYTDNSLRRDCAVVVSPKKALDMVMYELNPLFAEATNDTFYGRSTFADMYLANTNRPDFINTNHFTGLGLNMIWLQPIHPIGSEGRQTDPSTGLPYDPGSPYAVRNYWKVNSVLGDPASTERAMDEFSDFVQAMDEAGVGVMLDGTFNHSAWDCEVGSVGVEMFPWAENETDLIRDVRPQWYSKRNSYGEHATYYESESANDIAVAPDRIDFGKWSDAADFFFGSYDAIVQGPAASADVWNSPYKGMYLREEDRFDGHNEYTRELWSYFAYYPIYWLEKTGHPAGTPKSESHKGIDGLRCDFAQGLPSQFWEYCINMTRSVKWDFIFMAESLDGYVELGGSKRHGVGYRSARHFDVLNENMVFYWRDSFLAYPFEGPGENKPNVGRTPEPYTDLTWQQFDNKRNAFDSVPILLDLSCHDEVYPSDDPYRIFYVHAICAAMDGVPMLLYGQEAGAQNDADVQEGVTTKDHNFNRYENNFGKSIPNFKRYNCMTNIWAHRDWNLQGLYARVNKARLASQALRSQNNYFLCRTDNGSLDRDITAIAKFEFPGVSASSQDVVFCFINNNYWASTNRWATYALNATNSQGQNWFGIEAGRTYNIVDLISTNPGSYLWETSRSGADLIANGITVGLTQSAFDGKQAQYLKLVDIDASYPDLDGDGLPDFSDWDSDGDGLPDWWESANGLDPRNATGANGAAGDPDGDGISNLQEYLAGTDPNSGDDVLELNIRPSGSHMSLEWTAKRDLNYRLERTERLGHDANWQQIYFGTAFSEDENVADVVSDDATNRFYRVRVQP